MFPGAESVWTSCRNSIATLSGTIDVATSRGLGTTFTIRVPLTLAIIHSLLIRFRNDCFSIPIDDVRVIVSVPPDKIHAVQRHSTIEVRGELIPLVRMDGIFEWNGSSPAPNEGRLAQNGAGRMTNVVVLQSRGRTLGLCVDDLIGRGDVVIKPLSDNFIPVRGLSGASIMGDGAVCLMLDSIALIELGRRTQLGAYRRIKVIGRRAAIRRIVLSGVTPFFTAAQIERLTRAFHAGAAAASEAMTKWLATPTSISIDSVDQFPLEQATTMLGDSGEEDLHVFDADGRRISAGR